MYAHILTSSTIATDLTNALERIKVELFARVEENPFTQTVFVFTRHRGYVDRRQLFPKQWLPTRSTVL